MNYEAPFAERTETSAAGSTLLSDAPGAIRPKRILMLVTSLVLGGGAESQVVRLSAELQARGCDVTVVSLVQPSAHIDDLKKANVKVHSLEMTPGHADLRAVLRLRRIVRDFRPDVVHCHMYHANLLGRITRLFCRIPVLISTAHSLRENSRKGGPSWQREMLYRVTDRLGDRTTIICKAAYDRYVRIGAVPKGRLVVIHNGIDTQMFSRNAVLRSNMRSRLALDNRFTWLAVGRLVVQKDYPTLFKALEMLRARQFTVLIVGEGPLEQRLRAECEQRGLQKTVRFLGCSEDMVALYNAADAFVMSSQVEGLPMAALEAAAVGLPAVVTDVGATAEVVIGGVSGYVVPPSDPGQLASALDRLMHASPECRELMGRVARRHCREKYGIGPVVQRWMDLYCECLASRKARRHF